MPPYVRLTVMAVLSFVSMYVIMYATVDKLDDVYVNLNRAYMAALMTAPMVIFGILLMSMMYPSRVANIAILAVSIVALAAFWFLIRQQTAVADTQFLRAMIPHHSGAILMCQEAKITDQRIKDLCAGIIRSQQSEINQMRALLKERDREAASPATASAPGRS